MFTGSWIEPEISSECAQYVNTLASPLQDVLLPDEIQLLINHSQHRPNFVLAVLTKVVENLPTTDARKAAMDNCLTSFHQAVGSCERMIKTPIPRSYTRCACVSCFPAAVLLIQSPA